MRKLLKLLLITLSILMLSSTNFKQPEMEDISYEGLQWPVKESFVTGVDSSTFPLLKEYRDAERSIYRELKGVRNHPLIKSDNDRVIMARNVVNAASMAEVPWEAVFAIVRFESAFYHKVIARDGLGSIGLMQMHGVAWSYCATQVGRKVDKHLPADQLICGSFWLRYSMDQCDGSLPKGLSKYATGSLCGYAEVPGVLRLVNKRMKLFHETVDRCTEV